MCVQCLRALLFAIFHLTGSILSERTSERMKQYKTFLLLYTWHSIGVIGFKFLFFRPEKFHFAALFVPA